jgi:uncharacterized protein YqjF (DUF2071 family)
MYQDWSELLFVHYTFEPDIVQALLPAGLSVDTFPDASGQERAWVGCVPFRMSNVRPRFLPAVGSLSAFLETNLRTYVHREGEGPAVYFFSLEAANAIACSLARRTFNLPYHHANMSSTRTGDSFSYSTVRHSDRSHLHASWSVGQALEPSRPGSLAYFLAERYLLVTPDRGGRLMWGRVHHEPYRLREARVDRFEETLSRAAGLPERPIAHTCYCEGVQTRVWALRETPD